MVRLYYAPGACSLASHIVIEEVGVPYETVRLNLAEGDQRKPDYLKINPRGRVPACVVDGKVITENAGIIAYFAGGHPEAGLWPKDTWHQALAVSTISWLGSTVQGTYGHIARPARYADDAASQESMKAKARAIYGNHLEEIDTLLAGRKWCIGDRYSAVDAYLLVFYRWGNRGGYDVKALRHYTKLMDRVLDRPAVKKVMADEGITLD